jgi:Transposase DDE domain group 1
LRLFGLAAALVQEVTFVVHDDGRVGLDGLPVVFDDERAVQHAGVALAAMLASRLGIEDSTARLVRLRRDRPGAASAGRKVMALIFAMVLGADSIDDCEVLRAGCTRRLLGGWIPAPSTLGRFLRAFTFGHVRQLDALLGEALVRAWRAGASPGEQRLVIDVDSFVGEVCGRLKQGAAYGYTKLLGYHPILATRADTREVLHIRLRKGSANTQKGRLRFTDELIARVNRAGAEGVKQLRADSGLWSNKVFCRLEKAGWQYSIGVRTQKRIREAVNAIEESAWQKVEEYPKDGEAQIAETVYGKRLLVVRRTRLLGAQAQLWPDWRHFCFITNRPEGLEVVEAEHRDHAVVEQVIADLKDQALAHNLLRWTQLIGLPDSTVRAGRTLRRRWLQVAGRLTRRRQLLDASPSRPLALARRLSRRAQPNPRAPRRLRPEPHTPPEDKHDTPPHGVSCTARQQPKSPLIPAANTATPSTHQPPPAPTHNPTTSPKPTHQIGGSRLSGDRLVSFDDGQPMAEGGQQSIHGRDLRDDLATLDLADLCLLHSGANRQLLLGHVRTRARSKQLGGEPKAGIQSAQPGNRLGPLSDRLLLDVINELVEIIHRVPFDRPPFLCA